MPVVDDGEVRNAAGPERLRVGKIDPALGGEAGMADPVRPRERRGRERGIEVPRRAHVLDDLEPLTEADHLDGRGCLESGHDRLRVDLRDLEAQGRAPRHHAADPGEPARAPHELAAARDHVRPLGQRHPDDEAVHRLAPHGHARRIGPAPPERAQHAEQRRPDGRERARLVEVPRDPAHGSAPPLSPSITVLIRN